jgi:glycosyltransferase involved in cell wall biosynthesis
VISVVTPTYHTPPAVLRRTWESLRAQTHTEWEWVVWDDSDDDSVWTMLRAFSEEDPYRIVAHRSISHCGSIGRVKRRAFMVAEGDVLVELDHDDELTPDCLAEVSSAFELGVGFAYSDWCEILPEGVSGKYPDGWAYGYGGHYWSEEHGVWAMKAPPVNSTTIRHIVSSPNHVRAWSADLYRELDGHDVTLEVADDYELMVRTAVATRMYYIPRMLYRQHIGDHTAQRRRNALIQELVPVIAERYRSQIDAAVGSTISPVF